MPRNKHPNKDVERAIQHAEDCGWKVEKQGHWGVLKCPYYDSPGRCGAACQTGVWGTPKNPGNHAKQLRHAVDGCKVRNILVKESAAPTMTGFLVEQSIGSAGERSNE